MATVVDKVELLASGQVQFLDEDDNIIETAPSNIGIKLYKQGTPGEGVRLVQDGRNLIILVAANITRLQLPDEAEETGLTLTAQELADRLSTDFFLNSSAGGGGGGATPLLYAATLSQTGTSAPVATEVTTSTLGATIAYARVSPGVYTATASSAAFVADKTFVTLTPGSGVSPTNMTFEIVSTSVIAIRITDGLSTPADNLLLKAGFKIEVYPA